MRSAPPPARTRVRLAAARWQRLECRELLSIHLPPTDRPMPPAAASPPQWVLHPRRSVETASALSKSLSAPLPAAHVLVNRGLDDERKARRFLEPALETLHDPLE